MFLAFIPQTLEVYRIFALNSSDFIDKIFLSYISILFLSFSIWYAGRAISKDRKTEASISGRDIFIKEKAWKWTPRFLGLFPLLALGSGLINTVNGTTVVPWQNILILRIFFITLSFLPLWPKEVKQAILRSRLAMILPFSVGALGVAWITQKIKECMTDADENTLCVVLFLVLGVLFAAVLAIAFLFFVMNRGNLKESRIPNAVAETIFEKGLEKISGDELFSPGFILLLSFTSTLAFTTFTFPLISSGKLRFAVAILALIFLFFASWISKIENCNLIKSLLTVSAIYLFLTAFVKLPLAPHVGPIVIISIFLIVFINWSSISFYLGYKHKIPFITIMLSLAVLFSSFNWNDNHRLREVPSSESKSEPFPTLNSGFGEWIKAREDVIEKFGTLGASYPIYIVSAQGGGIFAAYHAALTLSGMQDLCPAFASHIFAISGVSGGSLGATVFSSLVKAEAEANADQSYLNQEKTCKTFFSHTSGAGSSLGPLATKANNLLDNDLLSPLLAAGLFPDFIQRFLPFIPYLSESIDRARGIEYAFEQAWKEPGETLKNSYYAHWNPIKAAPALVLNTTVVETGDRLVISPFQVNLPNLKDIRTVACKKDKKDINLPLSTAALLSARFTLVTPVAWFNRCDTLDNKPQKARLADGGYFENSGVSTAVDIGSKLEDFLKAKGWLEPISKESAIQTPKTKVIYLAITSQPSKTVPKAGSFNEIMSPFLALWNSRVARGLNVVAQVEYSMDLGRSLDDSAPKSSELPTFKSKYADHGFRQFYLYDELQNPNPHKNEDKNRKPFVLPLGWLLSDFSEKIIRQQIGYDRGEEIDRDYKKGCQEDRWESASNNLCVIRSISEELSP